MPTLYAMIWLLSTLYVCNNQAYFVCRHGMHRLSVVVCAYSATLYAMTEAFMVAYTVCSDLCLAIVMFAYTVCNDSMVVIVMYASAQREERQREGGRRRCVR